MTARNRSIRVNIILAAVLSVLSAWRLTLPSLETSKEAVASYQRKMDELKKAHGSGVPARVRISAKELNSDLDDWYRRERIDIGWPPWHTVWYFRGNQAAMCFPVIAPAHVRLVVVDVKLVPRGPSLDARSAMVWFGIVPVPGSVVAWISDRFSGRKQTPWRERLSLSFPEYTRIVGVEDGGLVLESQ